jgi:hypothetical protein
MRADIGLGPFIGAATFLGVTSGRQATGDGLETSTN